MGAKVTDVLLNSKYALDTRIAILRQIQQKLTLESNTAPRTTINLNISGELFALLFLNEHAATLDVRSTSGK